MDFQADAELLRVAGQGSGEDQRVVDVPGVHERSMAGLQAINNSFMVGLPYVRMTGATG